MGRGSPGGAALGGRAPCSQKKFQPARAGPASSLSSAPAFVYCRTTAGESPMRNAAHRHREPRAPEASYTP